MKRSIVTLAVATAICGVAAVSYAQSDQLKPAATPLAGAAKEMPLAGSAAARAAEAPGTLSTGSARIRQPSVETGVAQPDTVTESKGRAE